MSSISINQENRTRALWLSCLVSAIRTTLACVIVGAVTLYGPPRLSQQVAFPAFSYVTIILVVTDATLGDTIRGCWFALCATIQTLGPAILFLWLIGPARLTTIITSLAVALAAFVVALPQSTHVVAKRIALGQIVITYVLAYIRGPKVDAIMHPLHVAESTAVGVLACVLALLIPFPRLACSEVKQNCRFLAENASERMKLLVKAFSAGDKSSAFGFVSRAKPMGAAGGKVLQSTIRYQESMQWERLPLKCLEPYYFHPGGSLQDLEVPLRGMEMALSSCSFPVGMLSEELKNSLVRLEEHVSQTLEQAKIGLSKDSPTVPEPSIESSVEFLQKLQEIPRTHKDLPSFFFLFCMKVLHFKSLPSLPAAVEKTNTHLGKQNEFSFKDFLKKWTMDISCNRLVPALKCSLALGLAILFGSIYSKENGFWAGLPVAISHAVGREATFTIANVKLQGTVLGTVYGVLGSFLFHRFMPLRFFSILPWFIFTSFIRQSKMYGPAGGISAIIGAVLILGRKEFGPPKEFAIARIVETFIGLSCSIMIELLFQPKRASTLVKVQVSRSLVKLQDFVSLVSLQAESIDLEESQKKLRSLLNELKILIREADTEPNFWFLPFPSACYSRLLGSLSKMGDLLLFCSHAFKFLEQESQRHETLWEENVIKLECDLKLIRKAIGSSLQCFSEATSIKLPVLEKELQKKNIPYDIEMAKSSCPNFLMACRLSEEDIEKIVSSYLEHAEEVIIKLQGVEGDHNEFMSQTILGLTALGFCLSSLIKETKAIEEAIKEVLQWENPSKQINLYEISSKLGAVHN